MEEALRKIIVAIESLDIDGISEVVEFCIETGLEPMTIIEKGISPGMKIVGERFESGEYFLSDLIMAAETVKEAMKILEPGLLPGEKGKKGKIIIATVQGDIHEIGKNILGMLLSSGGYEVIDLGVDVPPARIVDTVRETGARLIGLSALLTTMAGSIGEVVKALQEAGLRDSVRIAIGGACTSERLRKDMNADAYGESAVMGLKIFDELGLSVTY